MCGNGYHPTLSEIIILIRSNYLKKYLHYTYIMANRNIKEKQKSQPILMSNIKSQKFQGYDFYHTICSKVKWETKGNVYQSPQEKAFEKAKDQDIRLCIKNEKGSSYGSMPFEELDKIYTENHYLYEILKDERKFYLDIEFPYTTEEESVNKLSLIFKLIKKCFGDCGIDTGYKRKRDFFSKNIGIGEQGGFKDIKKFSAHLVLNNGVYFKSVFDINKFARYMRQTINDQEEFHGLIFETDRARDYAIDFGVYTKNRLFKLPYQSKPNSNRIQKPAPKTPDSLESCLISFLSTDQLVDVSKITLRTEQKTYAVKNKSGRVIGHNISNNVAEFLEDFKLVLPDECPIPEGDVDSGSLEYVVKSIYNCKSVEWSCFCAVGMAIKRASGGNSFQLWVDWADKSGKPQNISEMQGLWGRFSVDKGYGFSTLLNMAKLCNPALISQAPYKVLFDMPHYENKTVVNKKYLDIEDFNITQTVKSINKKVDGLTILNKNEVSFIKSPMGTGKSFNIHKIQEHFNKIVYLSSKRAFATAMGKEFEEDGFKNYINLNTNERFECDKIIISLESFHQINPNDIDLLIVDESESIFNVIGSHTLQVKGEGLSNLLVFEKAVRTAKKVLVMDAFLSKRSFNAINTIRPNARASLTINEWKPAKRTATRCASKDTMYLQLKKCLKNGERCVVVSGSKNFAIQLVANATEEGLIEGNIDKEGIYEGSQAKLYHSGNPLDLSTKVNEEWSECKLLCYSPTITCGVSYDNENKKFDRLFVYMPNKFSACFRDATQALKRVRHFTKNEMFICLNTCGNYNKDMSPVYFDKVKELIYTYKQQIFTDEKHFISLQNTIIEEYKPLKNWVSEARIYNILEQNISGIYLEKVATTYLEIENIEIKDSINSTYEMPEYEMKDTYTWEEVNKLNCSVYAIEQKKMAHEHITMEEYWFMLADGFNKTLKNDVNEYNKALYWDFFIRDQMRRSHYYSNIKFTKLIHEKGIDELYEKTDSKKILELNNFFDERYSHVYKIFKSLGVITEDNKLDYCKEFTKDDLEPLLKDYEALRTKGGLKAFNQLLKHESIREWNKKEEEEPMDIDKMYIMVKHIASDLLGLETGRIKKKKKRVEIDGVKKQVFIGVFRFSPPKTSEKVFNFETNQMQVKEMRVLDVVYQDWLTVKPCDWFNDSGITSEEECEDI